MEKKRKFKFDKFTEFSEFIAKFIEKQIYPSRPWYVLSNFVCKCYVLVLARVLRSILSQDTKTKRNFATTWPEVKIRISALVASDFGVLWLIVVLRFIRKPLLNKAIILVERSILGGLLAKAKDPKRNWFFVAYSLLCHFRRQILVLIAVPCLNWNLAKRWQYGLLSACLLCKQSNNLGGSFDSWWVARKSKRP